MVWNLVPTIKLINIYVWKVGTRDTAFFEWKVFYFENDTSILVTIQPVLKSPEIAEFCDSCKLLFGFIQQKVININGMAWLVAAKCVKAHKVRVGSKLDVHCWIKQQSN